MRARRPFWLRLIGWALVAFIATLALLHAYVAVTIWWWRDHPPRETAFMAERLAELRSHNPRAELRYRFVPYERISTSLKRAMIAAEDSHFVEHEGFDWDGIQTALERISARGASSPAARRSRSNSRKICFCRRRGATGGRPKKR
jgi:monofunctional biosynthetic peptidoglycan transglycosylase